MWNNYCKYNGDLGKRGITVYNNDSLTPRVYLSSSQTKRKKAKVFIECSFPAVPLFLQVTFDISIHLDLTNCPPFKSEMNMN